MVGFFDKKILDILSNADLFYSKDSINIRFDKDRIETNQFFRKNKVSISSEYQTCFLQNEEIFCRPPNQSFDSYFYLSENRVIGLHDKILVLIHGYGSHRMDIYDSMAKRFAASGLDCFIYKLPLHFERKGDNDIPRKPRISYLMEMFRQSVLELKAIRSIITKEEPKKVGFMGFSFGGYCTSLLACLDSRIDHTISMASIGGFEPLIKHIEMGKDGFENRLAKDYLGIISPIKHTPVIKKDRILFIQGIFDARTPVREVVKLREKWDYPKVIWYPSNHLTFIAFNRLTSFLVKRFVLSIR